MTPQNESTWNFIYAHEGQNTCSVIATVKSFDIISSIVRAYNAEEVYKNTAGQHATAISSFNINVEPFYSVGLENFYVCKFCHQ